MVTINSKGEIESRPRELLSFEDVLLQPRYSDIRSRKEISIGNGLTPLPIISSPMDTVTEFEMAVALGKLGGIGVIHRYNSIEEQANIVGRLEMDPGVWIPAAAVGITGDYLERAQELASRGLQLLCIDVAHGHHILVKEALHNIKKALSGHKVHIMAGNVATLEAFNDLADWGANSIRVGIGGGSICSTRIQTGHGMPTLQSVIDCAKSDRDAVLVADGGIKNSGDMVKALAAGADAVMVGSLLAGTDEAPGDIVETSKGKHKTYRGMASKDAQIDWRGKVSSSEGISTMISYKGSVENIIEDLAKGIRSGFSYSGARNLVEFQAMARFVKQTSAGQKESSTHILRR
jgi:IMP dehydrogenase